MGKDIVSVYDLFVGCNLAMTASTCASTICVNRNLTGDRMPYYDKLARSIILSVRKGKRPDGADTSKVISTTDAERLKGMPSRWPLSFPQYVNIKDIAEFYTDLPFLVDPNYAVMLTGAQEGTLTPFGADMKTNVESITVRIIVVAIIKDIENGATA